MCFPGLEVLFPETWNKNDSPENRNYVLGPSGLEDKATTWRLEKERRRGGWVELGWLEVGGGRGLVYIGWLEEEEGWMSEVGWVGLGWLQEDEG